MYFDWTYILVLIGAGLCMAASARVNSTYAKYARVQSRTGLTGAQTAQRILQTNGITDVQIQHVAGNLTDHYNPRTKVVNLSDATFGASSVAAVAVAAHECGHVLQHHRGYAPLSFRTALVPVANFGSRLGLPMILIGLFLGAYLPALSFVGTIGVWVYAAAVLFQFVTLPVEFDASHRALVMLTEYGILSADENAQSKKVLDAAALTYVAAAASSLLQLLRLMMLLNRRRR